MLDFAKDKGFWERVRTSPEFEQHRRETKELYDKAFKTPPRSHTAEDILENNDHGLWRLQFDHIQSSALLSLIYPENEEYYKNLLESVWVYLNDYTWAPLGHYTEYYYQRTPKDFDYGLIDIFAASAALGLAEIKNLFMDRFPKLLTDRISYEIRRRTIEPFLSRRFFWETHDNNWTAVCTGAVGSVLMYEAPELYYENRERLHSAMESYLASYKDDGMCVEGVGYWSFGFGFFATFALLEREFTKGEVDWFKRPKVKEISKFISKMFLQTNVMATYSDAGFDSKYSVGLPHMLRYVYGDEVEKLPIEHGIVVYDNTHFNFALRSFIYYSEENNAKEMATDVTYSMPSSCYLTKRTGSYAFTVKGGNNGESHNHIDVGSFIIARNNKQIIADIGACPYWDGYHTDRRYTFFNPSAYAHSIPIFDGEGEDSIARDDVYVEYDWEKQRARLDIANGYGLDFVKKVDRVFDFEENRITLTDTFELDKEVEIKERFISVIEPKIVNGVAVIDDVSLVNEQGIEPVITVKETEKHLGGKYNVYILDYILPKGKSKFEIQFKIIA
ncbi:MAG: heparinase II/III family protein [Clostridia bacterium]|nr:heparinase II/III family protein [Clostridia bacterium]